MRLQARVMAETMSRFGSATMRMVLRVRMRLLWIASGKFARALPCTALHELIDALEHDAR